jgi:uncharacterized Zn-binding protein involved in type VI secretion
MPQGLAARLADATAHGAPLEPGPGATNVFIGGMPAWRGARAAAVAEIVSAAAAAVAAIAQAQAVAAAAAGTPTGPAAQANFLKTVADEVARVSSLMTRVGGDTIACPVLKGPVPDGRGVVVTGSQTVLVGGFPACRVGDTIQEATSVNTIAAGCQTVVIGG